LPAAKRLFARFLIRQYKCRYSKPKKCGKKIFRQCRNLFNQINPNDFVGGQTSPFFRQSRAAWQARKMPPGVCFNF
jgi:hypothetical protein